MPHTDTDAGRRGDGPTQRGMLRSAAAGAALFLGVGAALPMWPGPSAHRVPLWGAAPGDAFTLYMSQLIQTFLGTLLTGAVAGLLGYFACLRLRQRNGGGA